MNKLYEKKFIQALSKAAKGEALLRQFLSEMLTSKEREEIVRRFEILSRLESGEAQRSIAADLGLGIATVTRGSHVLQSGASAFKKVMNKKI